MNNAAEAGDKTYFRVMFAVILAIMIAFMFRGSTEFGMNYDEVNRVNNIFAWFDSSAMPYKQVVSSLDIWSVEIPLLYKSYISSFSVVKFMPIILFEDNVFAIRFLAGFYFCLAATVLFLFLSRYSLLYAAAVSVLMVFSPVFYPSITVNMGFVDHVVWLCLMALLLSRLQYSEWDWLWLGLTALVAGLAVNQQIYSLWGVAGFAAGTVAAYPGEVLSRLRRWYLWLIIPCMFVIGSFNFWPYNIVHGLATFQPLIERVLDPSSSTETAIDMRHGIPLMDELEQVMGWLGAWWGRSFLVFVATVVIGMITSVLFRIWARSDSERRFSRLLVGASTAFVVTFFCILITPNTTRSPHFYHLSPYLEMTALAWMPFLYFLISRYVSVAVRFLPAIAAIVMLVAVGMVSVERMNKYRDNLGEGRNSPVIFELSKYLINQGSMGRCVIFNEWGQNTQPYFITSGEFLIQSMVFVWPYYEARQIDRALLKRLEQAVGNCGTGNALMFPFYVDTSISARRGPIRKQFMARMDSLGVSLERSAMFENANGEPVYEVFELTQVDRAIEALRDDLETTNG